MLRDVPFRGSLHVMLDVSTPTAGMSWSERERIATLILAVAEKRQVIMDRLLRYREENARPEDIQRGRPLPQEEAASRAKVRPRQWQRWERGVSVPHPNNLAQLAKRLRIPIAEFFPEESGDTTNGDTPDLMGTVNGDMPDDLRQQLADLDAKLDQILAKQDTIEKGLANSAADHTTISRIDAVVEELRTALGGGE